MEQNFMTNITANFIKNLEEVLPTIAGKLIGIIVILLIWPKIIKIVLKAIEKMAAKKEADSLLITFICSLVKTVMYITLFFILIGILGIKATSLVTILGTAGIAVGLALQGSLSNLASGILILFFKQFSKGNFISTAAGDIQGEVKSIHILYTILTTLDGIEVIIPNSQLANAAILNYSKNPYRRLDLTFTVSNKNSVEKIMSLLQTIIDRESRIVKNDAERPTFVAVSQSNGRSVDYKFRAWTKNAEYFDVLFDVQKNVKLIFDENNIEIPYDKMDLYIKENK